MDAVAATISGLRLIKMGELALSETTHRWRAVYEEAVFGGSFLVGWECIETGEFISQSELTPGSVHGVVAPGEARLVGPHGGHGTCSDGSLYKEQIVDGQGNITIVR